MGSLPWADGEKCPQGYASGGSPSLRSFAGLSWALPFLSHPKPGRSSQWLPSHGPGDSFRALQQKVLSMTGEDEALRQRGGSTDGRGGDSLAGRTQWDMLGQAHSSTVKDPGSLKPMCSRKHQPGSPGYLSCEPYFLMDCAFKPYFMLLES